MMVRVGLCPKPRHWYPREEALIRVWPTIVQDVIQECTQRKEREWWEDEKHNAAIAMIEVLCLTWLSISGADPGFWER